MKKTFLFIAVVSAFSFASCKKDRTCTCTQTNTDGTPAMTFVATIVKSTKTDAKKLCIDQTYTEPGNVVTQTCKLN